MRNKVVSATERVLARVCWCGALFFWVMALMVFVLMLPVAIAFDLVSVMLGGRSTGLVCYVPSRPSQE